MAIDNNSERKANDINDFKLKAQQAFTTDTKDDKSEPAEKPVFKLQRPSKVVNDTCTALTAGIASSICHELKKPGFYQKEVIDELKEFLEPIVETVSNSLVALVTEQHNMIPKEIMDTLNRNLDEGFSIDEIKDKDSIRMATSLFVTYLYAQSAEFLNTQECRGPAMIIQAMLMSSNAILAIYIAYVIADLWETNK